MAKATVLGITIDDPSLNEIFEFIDSQMTHHRQTYITTVNSELLQLSLKNPAFKIALEDSAMRLCDGVGVQWAAAFTNKHYSTVLNYFRLPFSLIRLLLQPNSGRRIIKHRTTGRLLFEDLLEYAERNNYSVFFLGGGESVAQQVAQKALTLHPKISISGIFAGRPDQPQEILAALKPSNLLFVAFGSPKQEIFIRKHLENLQSNVIIGVGGTFDAFVGAKPIGSPWRQIRPPQWVHNLGLESFWRLATQPNRFKRVIKSTVGLAIKVASSR